MVVRKLSADYYNLLATWTLGMMLGFSVAGWLLMATLYVFQLIRN
jgi:hypothetical protein